MVAKTHSCCTPDRGAGPAGQACRGAETRAATAPAPFEQEARAKARGGLGRDAVKISGGASLLGTKEPYLPADCEGPLRRTKLRSFFIERGAVTNAHFAAFVADTGYVTEAEDIGWSFVFAAQVPETVGATQGVLEAQWWRRVDGSNWRAPHGPGSEAAALPDHPVVQVSWNDARAYAAWAGGRLPSEAEWEHAARGGLGDVIFPWGDDAPTDAGPYPCNIWQGRFPEQNTAADGYATTAPALSFAPNGYGLF
ncbi:MAG: SUMF1/EgtB/PvdO family nonheme iron enzyme, partial [Pseudomonadota bacterium]